MNCFLNSAKSYNNTLPATTLPYTPIALYAAPMLLPETSIVIRKRVNRGFGGHARDVVVGNRSSQDGPKRRGVLDGGNK
jgi:hypothetical protein